MSLQMRIHSAGTYLLLLLFLPISRLGTMNDVSMDLSGKTMTPPPSLVELGPKREQGARDALGNLWRQFTVIRDSGDSGQ